MAKPFSAGCERWVSVIGRLQRGRHGRTGVRSGSSDRSGGIALTMSLCLASGTFVTCSRRIKDITMRPARIYHWRRMRRSRAPSRPSVKPWPYRSWAGFTTSMFERKFPTGTGFVETLARPGGNATGFTNFVPTMATKWLEVLKEIAPQVQRAVLMFNPQTAPYVEQYYQRPFEAAAPSFGVQ